MLRRLPLIYFVVLPPVNLTHRISFFHNRNLVTLGYLAVVSVFISWILLPFGPGITNDSLLYLECGDHLFSKNGFTVIGHDGELAFAADRFPVYPVLLKLLSFCGIQPILFQLLLFILFSFLLLRVLVAFSLSGSRLLVTAIALISLLFPFVLVYYNLWTEGLYLVLFLLTVLLFYSGKNRSLLMLLILLSLTRMVGLTVGIAIALVWIVNKEYAKAASAFFASILPVVAWYFAGFLLGAENSRHFSIHWIASFTLNQFFETTGSLISSDSTVQTMLGIIISLLPAFIAFRHFLSGKKIMDKTLLFLIILFYVYPLFLFFSISFLDYSTPMDYRILAPQFLVMLLILSKVMLKKNSKPLIIAVPLMLLSGLSFFLHAEDYDNLHKNGYGYHSKESQHFTFVSVIKNLPKNFRWYSNTVHGVYHIAGKNSHELPLKFDIHDNTTNKNYETAWHQLLHEFNDTTAIIVWIRSGATEKSFITYEELKNTEGFHVMYDDWLCLVMSSHENLSLKNSGD